jgi:hypothetical protein
MGRFFKSSLRMVLLTREHIILLNLREPGGEVEWREVLST